MIITTAALRQSPAYQAAYAAAEAEYAAEEAK